MHKNFRETRHPGRMTWKDTPEECQYDQQGHGQICRSLNQYEYGLQGHGQMSELKSRNPRWVPWCRLSLLLL